MQGTRRGRADLVSIRESSTGKEKAAAGRPVGGEGHPACLPALPPLTTDPEACLSVIPPWVLVPYRSGLGSPHLLPVVNLAPGAGHLSFSEKVKSVWGVGWGWGKDGRSWT